MSRIDKSVFISYRRTNLPWALNIYQNLHHNGYDVFFDYEGIGAGDFGTIIIENITSRAHFLVVLTPSALERCSEPGDWFRLEIETAIESKRNIIPLMLEGFDFNNPKVASQLTGQLATLRSYNGIGMHAEYFFAAMEKVDKFLNVQVAAIAHPPSLIAKQTAIDQKVAAEMAPPVQVEELTAQEYFERGYISSDTNEKIRLYTEAIRLNPGFSFAYNNRGAARESNGDLDGALHDYEEAIRFQPDNHMARLNRAIAREGKGDLAGALLDYYRVVELKPDFAEAYYNRAIACEANNDFDGAIRDYTEAIRFKPDYAEAYNNRGNARQNSGDLDGALYDYDQTITIRPDDPKAHNNRGSACQDKGDLDAALQSYTEAIRIKPDFAEAYYNRGNARQNKGDRDGGVQDYTAALQLNPEYLNARYNRAKLLRSLGRPFDAALDFQEYLRAGGGERNGDTDEIEQVIRDLQQTQQASTPPSQADG